MPSPFPGMDPYIERPRLWVDFHNNLASELQAQLNRQIQPRYVARLTPYETYEIVEVARPAAVRPDLAVHASRAPGPQTSSAATITPATAESSIPLEVPLTLYGVEVRLTGAERLVTAIEILSPVNKRPGHEGYFDYRRKRRDLLRSAAHFIEIDLLRGGERSPLEVPVPLAPYYATVSRVEYRPTVQVWSIQLDDRLPVLPVPLLEEDPDAAIDLQAAHEQIYERGGYGSEIDYREPPPPPPLSPEQACVFDRLLRSYRG